MGDLRFDEVDDGVVERGGAIAYGTGLDDLPCACVDFHGLDAFAEGVGG